MKDRLHPLAKDSGLTIAELVVSMGILAFIALSVATMVSTSVHLDKLAQERSIATSLASGRIMRITSMPFQIIGDVGRYGLLEETLAVGPPPTFTTAYGLIPGYPEYSRLVTLLYDTPVAGMMTVEVSVSWRHVTGEERSHTMIEILDPGLE